MVSKNPLEGNTPRYGSATARIAGVLATLPEGVHPHQDIIVSRAGLSQSTASRMLAQLVAHELILDEICMDWDSRGPVPKDWRPTPAFFEALDSNLEWRIAAELQQRMQATGMDEARVLEDALGLSHQSSFYLPVEM